MKKNVKHHIFTGLLISGVMMLSGCNNKFFSSNKPGKTEQVPITIIPLISDNENLKISSFNTNWTRNIESLRPVILKCLVGYKNANSVKYAEQVNSSKAIIILSNVSGNTQECIADLNTKVPPTITKSEYVIPSNIPSFYPVGRSVGKCNESSMYRNSRNQVMGTICNNKV